MNKKKPGGRSEPQPVPLSVTIPWTLRHSAGQIMIDKGFEPTWVQRHLRHELFVTTQFYIKKQTERDYFVKMPISV